MSNDILPTSSDWRESITLPPGFAERIRDRLAEIERAGAFLRDFDPVRLPTMPEVLTLPLEGPVTNGTAESTPAPPVATPQAALGGGQLSWQHARDGLIVFRRQGQKFTSLRDLAARLGCSEGLIRKAIKGDVGLRAWAAGSKRTRRTAPAATGLERAIHRTPQRRESSPELAAIDAEPLEEPDVVLQQLIEAASPAERARIHAMTPEQRTSLLRLVAEQNSDRDTPRLRKRA